MTRMVDQIYLIFLRILTLITIVVAHWRKEHLDQMMLGKLDAHVWMNEVRQVSSMLYNNNLQMDHR